MSTDEKMARLLTRVGLSEDEVTPVMDSLNDLVAPWAKAMRKKHTEEYCLKLLMACFGALAIASEDAVEDYGESLPPTAPTTEDHR